MSVIVIGDVHGCFKTLKALINKLPKDQEICFVGDLIDRGPNSKEVVQFVIDNNYNCVRGNHEDMMLSCCDNVRRSFNCGRMWWDKDVWTLNGGKRAFESYLNVNMSKDRPFEEIDNDTLDNHLDWMGKLPVYIEFDVEKDGRKLVVSHSFIGNQWRKRNTDNYRESEVLWTRPYNLKDNKDIYNIHGHTPSKDPKVKSFYSNVDTGCVFGKSIGLGHLTAIQYPEMKIYQQEMIDIE